MNADLLRRAATRLRENAAKASKAPWVAAGDGLVWPDCMGDPACGAAELENAYYVEMMHPPVALALARLFDVHATLLNVDREAGDHFTAVFAAEELASVARAVLREDQ